MYAGQVGTHIIHMYAVQHLVAVAGAVGLLCFAHGHVHLCPVLTTTGLAHAGNEREAALSEFYEEWKDEVRLHAAPHLRMDRWLCACACICAPCTALK